MCMKVVDVSALNSKVWTNLARHSEILQLISNTLIAQKMLREDFTRKASYLQRPYSI